MDRDVLFLASQIIGWSVVGLCCLAFVVTTLVG